MASVVRVWDDEVVQAPEDVSDRVLDVAFVDARLFQEGGISRLEADHPLEVEAARDRAWQRLGEPAAEVRPLVLSLAPGHVAHVEPVAVKALEDGARVRCIAVGKRRDDERIDGVLGWNRGHVARQQLDDGRGPRP